jgi:hypothetical protein
MTSSLPITGFSGKQDFNPRGMKRYEGDLISPFWLGLRLEPGERLPFELKYEYHDPDSTCPPGQSCEDDA